MNEGSIESTASEIESPTHARIFDTEASQVYTKGGKVEDEPETISIPDDISSLLFVAKFSGQACFYEAYISC